MFSVFKFKVVAKVILALTRALLLQMVDLIYHLICIVSLSGKLIA